MSIKDIIFVKKTALTNKKDIKNKKNIGFYKF